MLTTTDYKGRKSWEVHYATHVWKIAMKPRNKKSLQKRAEDVKKATAGLLGALSEFGLQLQVQQRALRCWCACSVLGQPQQLRL